jgi:hypothetical protein
MKSHVEVVNTILWIPAGGNPMLKVMYRSWCSVDGAAMADLP